MRESNNMGIKDNQVGAVSSRKIKLAAFLLRNAPNGFVGGVLSGVIFSFATNILSAALTASIGLYFALPGFLFLLTGVCCYPVFSKNYQDDPTYSYLNRKRARPEELKVRFDELCKSKECGQHIVRYFVASVLLFALASLLLIASAVLTSRAKRNAPQEQQPRSSCQCPCCSPSETHQEAMAKMPAAGELQPKKTETPIDRSVKNDSNH